MTYQTWREVIEREENAPGGHAGPTGVGNLPRPKERGGDVPFAEMCERMEPDADNESRQLR